MKSAKIPLPVTGVDLLSGETSLGEGFVRRAENVDLARDGGFSRRGGYAVLSTDDHHSIVYLKTRDRLIIGKGDLAVLADTSLNTIASVDMGSNTALDVCEENGRVYVTNAGRLVYLRAYEDVFSDVGVPPVETLPTLSPHDAGGYLPGGYAVAVSKIDAYGEEGPARHCGVVTLTTPGAIRLTGLPLDFAHSYRIYVTPTNGDVLYRAEDIPGATGDFILGRTPDGNMPATLDLQRMPSGRWVRYHGGRMYVARGKSLWFSEPLRPHLCNQAHNGIGLSANARMLEPVAGGIYVADDKGVLFYAGLDPTKFTVRRVSTDKVLTGTAIALPASAVGEVGQGQDHVVLWLSESGYYYGREDGTAVPVNPGRIKLDPTLTGRSAFIKRSGMKQVVTTVNSSTVQTFGVAVDSVIQ